jgi:hypothetical protein
MQSDRFAREIVAILVHSGAARSRRLMRNSLGRAKAISSKTGDPAARNS